MSQSITFVGKVYNKRMEGKGDKARLYFRLAVRKNYVSEEDKKAGKTNVFIPMVIYGKRAEALDEYFPEGRPIIVSNCEYVTWEYEEDGETRYGHNFRVGDWAFVPEDTSEERSSKKSKKSKASKKRYEEEEDDYEDIDEDDEEEEAPRSKRKKEEKKKSKASKKSSRFEEDDDEDDDTYLDIDEDDLPF